MFMAAKYFWRRSNSWRRQCRWSKYQRRQYRCQEEYCSSDDIDQVCRNGIDYLDERLLDEHFFIVISSTRTSIWPHCCSVTYVQGCVDLKKNSKQSGSKDGSGASQSGGFCDDIIERQCRYQLLLSSSLKRLHYQHRFQGQVQ